MTNLGGQICRALLEAFETASTTTSRPCSSPIPIKGFGLPLAGHKDNHAGLMTGDADRGVPRAAMDSGPATNGTGSRG